MPPLGAGGWRVDPQGRQPTVTLAGAHTLPCPYHSGSGPAPCRVSHHPQLTLVQVQPNSPPSPSAPASLATALHHHPQQGSNFTRLFKLLLEDALLLQEALLTALRPLQAEWVDAPPLPLCSGIFAPVFDLALDLFPSLLPASLGLQGQNSA